MSTQVEETTSATSLIDVEGKLFNGVVKWFNSKTGYGYVTVLEKDLIGQDIFVHHTAIDVSSRIYKYLLQGEYVSIEVMKSDSEKYDYQVKQVTGILGGKLMCEVRNQRQKLRSGGDTLKEEEV
tara:strand:- start:462 stop:833 length:372 start_codon:yes stop_codon:yes gene_type:complete